MSHRSYLLDTTPDAFVPKPFAAVDASAAVALARASVADVVRCRFLWVDVGRGFWTERQRWSDARWAQHLARADIAFWIASAGGADIGFFELAARKRSVKIEGIGLVTARRGQGLGGPLLSAATQVAFATGTRRVCLHTATDDHPNALPNYRARGYRVYRESALRSPMR